MTPRLPKALEKVIESFGRLPGIGPKSASRLGFYLLSASADFNNNLAMSVSKLKTEVKICQICFGVSETDICQICADSERSKKVICVVERADDVISLERMGAFNGKYHVLGGVINPLQHVSPNDLRIDELVARLKKEKIEELIIATNPTMEGEATALYIKNKIIEEGIKVKITAIGRGLPMGADLGFADQATLSRAMDGRREI